MSGGRAGRGPAEPWPRLGRLQSFRGFEQPVRIMNDACLQALGSYDGGRMLFLGLGTAVGSALIADHLVLSLDMGRMHWARQRVWELLGDQGLRGAGRQEVAEGGARDRAVAASTW